MACVFYLIGDTEFKSGRRSWLEMDSLYAQGPSIGYLYAFYWSLMTTTTIGYGDITPVSPSGRIFGLVAMIIGASVFAYGVTNVLELVSGMNQQEHAFREKMDRISSYMSFRNIPNSLRSDVRDFFLYTHRTKTERNMLEVEKEILGEMSPSLSHEVVLFVNRSIVDKVVFFRECDHRFFQRIVRSLEPSTFAPNELVMKEGEVGSKLYIISKGVVEMLKGENLQRIDTKSDGAHFGMISIIENGPSQGKRICSVRTLTYCDFRTISKRAFNRGLRRYPGVKEDTSKLVDKEFKNFKKLVRRSLDAQDYSSGYPRTSSSESIDDLLNEAKKEQEEKAKTLSPPNSPISSKKSNWSRAMLAVKNAKKDNKKDNASCIPSPAKKLKKVNSLAQIRRHSDMRNGSGLLNSNRRHSDLRDIIEEQDEDHDDKTRNRVRSSSIDSNGSLGMTIELSEQLSEMMARLGIFLDGQDEKEANYLKAEQDREKDKTRERTAKKEQKEKKRDLEEQLKRDSIGLALKQAIDSENGIVLSTGERAPPPPSISEANHLSSSDEKD